MQIPRRILVVDDDPAIRTMLDICLQRAGYDVDLVEDGAEALVAIAERPPDAVVSDIMMPRLDGFALCREIRAVAAWRSIPIVLFSAADRGDPDDVGDVYGVVRVDKTAGLGALLGMLRGLLPAADDVAPLLREIGEEDASRDASETADEEAHLRGAREHTHPGIAERLRHLTRRH